MSLIRPRVLALLTAAFLTLFLLIRLMPIDCRYQDVDILTGRIRFSRYVAFWKVSERIEETALSRETIARAKPDWQRVNTFSSGLGYSPHHRFHGAIHQIITLENLWQIAHVDKTTRRRIVFHVLLLWQHAGADSLASRYIDGLAGLCDENRESLLRSIGAINMPEEHSDGNGITITVFYPDGRPMERVQGYRDSSGRFVKHGTWESWYLGGRRECYGHFERGKHHGRRYEWNSHGKLLAVEVFDNDKLINYESQNIENHPDYKKELRYLEVTP